MYEFTVSPFLTGSLKMNFGHNEQSLMSITEIIIKKSALRLLRICGILASKLFVIIMRAI